MALLAVGVPGPGAPPANADEITGYDHPADVFAFAAWKYVPATVTVNQGQSFKFGNYDPFGGIPAHSLDELVPGCTAPPYTKNNAGNDGTCAYPRFSSGLVDHGQVHAMHGVDKLAVGSYEFICQVHPFMTGTLIVK